MFATRKIAVRDLYLPEGCKKTLSYEHVSQLFSLKLSYHHVKIRDIHVRCKYLGFA